MAHKISLDEAYRKYEYMLRCNEQSKRGIKPGGMSRAEKRRLQRLSKMQRFVEMLKRRGGYYKQKRRK